MKKISNKDESYLVPNEQGEHHASHGKDERFWGSRGAGILLIAQNTGRVLLVLRSELVNEPGTWGMPGGKIDDEDESPKLAAIRETKEEVGYTGPIRLVPAHAFKAGNFKYFNFIGIIPDEFKPKLDWENNDADWFEMDNLPSPLHFGIKYLLFNSGSKIKNLVQII